MTLFTTLPPHHHVSVLGHVQNLMSTWGYPMLFGLLCSCGVGVPLPEDIPLLLAGYFVAIGKMNLALAAISAWCGIIAGDCLLYTFGRKFGINITRIPIVGKEVTTDRIAWVSGHFRRHGVWVVAFGRLLAGVRGAMVVTAGIIRYPFWRFIIADGAAAVFSGGVFVYAGYLAGKKLGDLDALSVKLEKYEREVVIYGIAAAVLIWLLWYYFHARHKKKAARKAPSEAELRQIIEETKLPEEKPAAKVEVVER